MTVRAVFFDVGETLIDESRLWRGWAAYLATMTLRSLDELPAALSRCRSPR